MRFILSAVLHTALNGVRYRLETEPRLTYPTYGTVGPIG